MSQFVPFDPEKHEGQMLYEIQKDKTGNVIDFVVVPADVSFEQASQTPWYYVVKAEEGE